MDDETKKGDLARRAGRSVGAAIAQLLLCAFHGAVALTIGIAMMLALEWLVPAALPMRVSDLMIWHVLFFGTTMWVFIDMRRGR